MRRSDDVEGAGRRAEVVADLAMTERALPNLIANAREALPHGGTITLRAGEETLAAVLRAPGGDIAPGRYVTVDVGDDGVGMGSDAAARAADPS